MNKKDTIRSTGGDCYRVAGNMAVDNPHMKLCHGIVTGHGPLNGLLIGHAWVEVGDIVIDYSNGHKVTTRKEKYYDKGKITDVVRYKGCNVADLLLSHQNYGPWDERVTLEKPIPIRDMKIYDTKHTEPC